MDVVKKIEDGGYTNILWQANNKLLDELWLDGINEKELQKIWLNKKEKVLTRLIAAEILFKKDNSFPGSNKKIKILLAELYTEALADKGTVNGNIWGLPGFIGQAGENLLKSDANACIDSLKLLLNNSQQLIYVGSREATTGNEYRYRVKDIAAFYLSKFLHLKYSVFKSPEEREIEIKKLLQQIK
ncbi:MAG TPA: hypothetical protein VK796_08535 [Cytophaga sp.]|jgi:hypothetical protein|nr:hypothetical protein [Cytophaga sp.]